MEQRPLTRCGVRCRGVEFPLVGQFSPPHPVTLTDEEKSAIGVPAAAKRFVWSYPVAGWTAVDGGERADTAAAVSFLSVGGFVYLDERNRALHATTLVPSALEAGGLQFRAPAPWVAEWTATLMRHGRFQRVSRAPARVLRSPTFAANSTGARAAVSEGPGQPAPPGPVSSRAPPRAPPRASQITIKALNDLGAHHFCWLRPGEVIPSADGTPCAEQPNVPHGGFAYLFHDDVLSSTPEQRVLDRYFACASGDEYVPMDEHEAAIAAEGHAALASSFGLVSELAALNALHDAAASQPTGEAHDALTRQIDALELQLSAATKCVACFDADKDTILNCGHVALCRHCATRVTSCPLCRCAITERRACFR